LYADVCLVTIMVCVGGLSRVRFSASYEMNVGIMYGTYLLQAVFRVGLGCSVCVCVCIQTCVCFKHVFCVCSSDFECVLYFFGVQRCRMCHKVACITRTAFCFLEHVQSLRENRGGRCYHDSQMSVQRRCVGIKQP